MYTFFLIVLTCASISLVAAKVGDKSDKMCRKYAEAVYTEEPDLGMNSGFNKVSDCGIVSVPLIIGGEKATYKEFPHFALIGFGNTTNSNLKWYCGGSLISERFVLTAAHCNESQKYGPAQKVRLGLISLTLDEDDGDDTMMEDIIEEMIYHPDYTKHIKYNDISLFRLKNAVEFTPYIRPACLNTNNALQEHSAIATGFGKTAYDDTEESNILMKVTLDIFDRKKCEKFFPPVPVMRDGFIASMICAGVLKGGKDTCQGDSGGPIQIILEEPYCMYSIIGVTSFGKFCGFENSPAVYTNVSHYISWIEEHVWKNE